MAKVRLGLNYALTGLFGTVDGDVRITGASVVGDDLVIELVGADVPNIPEVQNIAVRKTKTQTNEWSYFATEFVAPGAKPMYSYSYEFKAG